MPLVSRGPYYNPYLVYDAPVNEKTKELRKKFDMDDETGYPRAYNWRPLARLGQEYNPEDIFFKLDDFDEKAYYGYKAYFTVGAILGAAVVHGMTSYYYTFKWYSRPYIFLGVAASFVACTTWYQNVSLRRQNMVNTIDVEYLQSHPERFGKIYRPKMREILYENRYVR